MSERSHIQKYYASLAASYDVAALIQHEVANRLLNRLNYIRIQPKVIVELGSATGYNLNLLQEKYPKSFCLGIDFTIEMLQASQTSSKLSAVCATAQHLPIQSHTIDIVFINLLLHWLNDLQEVFKECLRVLKPGGLLFFSTLGPDTFQELRYSWHNTGAQTSYMHFTDMHLIGDQLIETSFADPVMDVENITMTYRDLSALIKELKQQGFRNLNTDRAKHLYGKNQFIKFAEEYQNNYSIEGEILPITYEIIYGQAWAPVTIKAKNQVVDIPVNFIRRNFPDRN